MDPSRGDPVSARVKPHTCGAAVVWAMAPNGGRIPLNPYPDPEGTIRVDVLGPDLIVLAASAPSSRLTRRYEAHRCGPARGVRPERRPGQLTLGGVE